MFDFTELSGDRLLLSECTLIAFVFGMAIIIAWVQDY